MTATSFRRRNLAYLRGEGNSDNVLALPHSALIPLCSVVTFLLWQVSGGSGVRLSDQVPPASPGQYSQH